MIKQLFKLIWNRKKSNFLMIAGILISFMALYGAMTSITYGVFNCFKPLGFSYEDVWILTMDWKNQGKEEVKETMIQIENLLKSYSEIENFALSENYIFQPLVTSQTEFTYNNHTATCAIGLAGDRLNEVLDIELLTGRWFNEGDRGAARSHAIINQKAKDEYFSNENALGKILLRDSTEYEIIGIIGEFRTSGELSGSSKTVLRRLSYDDEVGLNRLVDDGWHRILLKVAPGTGIELEERLMKNLALMAKDWTLKISTMESEHSSALKTTLIFPIIILIICGFLVFNVALGLFGVIWYNTSRRRAEIGLRRALGATGNVIYKQIVGETLVLVTFGVFLGSFFALQFPLLNIVGFVSSIIYYTAFIISVVFIYLLAIACALYPSWLASRIQPATALHNE
ncbi:MAG: FtsX-like permease family protein [candidate division Zixibacteria bacterium]|nr:FtsX-like permease family protein [candidate division Zixibacteria bacterium]